MNGYVVLAVVLIAWINTSYVVQFVIPSWLSGYDHPSATAVVLYTVFLVMAIVTYYKAMMTHPGRVPAQWREGVPPQCTASEAQPLNANRVFCVTCQHWKPDRTHHCSICRRCILRYDHHCPWIDNCVGYYNHKYFLLTASFLPLTCWVIIFSAWDFVWRCFPEAWFGAPPATATAATPTPSRCPLEGFALTHFCLAYGAAVIFGILLTAFSLQHLFLLTINRTTVETILPERTNKYNVGCYENWRSVCGEWYLWLIPVPAHEVTKMGGTGFPTRPAPSADLPPFNFQSSRCLV
eukprot:Sspe_Gene.13464::Locus_4607_Transcript_1_1_Confidence_1.000_Length_1132::g.13464::m.13464/K20028/ZDHHC2_15_20; palmitoyltransferase ZDHHC2/15/20